MMKRKSIVRCVSVWTAVIGVFFISGIFWADFLDPLIFNETGEYWSGGILGVLSPLLLQVNLVLSFGWFYGIPLFLFGLVGTIVTHPQTDTKEGVFRRHRIFFSGLGVALIAHVLVLLSSVQFFFVPPDTFIRPMGWALMMLIISAGTFLVAVPTGVIAMIKERPRFLGLIVVFLGLTPMWFSKYLINFASKINGFHLAD